MVHRKEALVLVLKPTVSFSSVLRSPTGTRTLEKAGYWHMICVLTLLSSTQNALSCLLPLPVKIIYVLQCLVQRPFLSFMFFPLLHEGRMYSLQACSALYLLGTFAGVLCSSHLFFVSPSSLKGKLQDSSYFYFHPVLVTIGPAEQMFTELCGVWMQVWRFWDYWWVESLGRMSSSLAHWRSNVVTILKKYFQGYPVDKVSKF